jgi:hypothetical protein
VLATFGHLLFVLLHANSAAAGAELESGGGLAVTAPLSGERILAFLNSKGPRLHFAVPPPLCRRPASLCFEPHELRGGHLLAIFRGLRQYVLLTPTLAVVQLWAALVLQSESQFQLTSRVLTICGKLSTLLALYSLFVLYAATHDHLREWRTTAKFISIKLFLVIALLQEPLFEYLVHGGSGTDGSAESSSGSGASTALLGSAEGGGAGGASRAVGSEADGAVPAAARCLHGASRAHFWGMLALALESMGMALLLRAAFPASELEGGAAHEYEATVIELELLRHQSGPAPSLTHYSSLGESELPANAASAASAAASGGIGASDLTGDEQHAHPKGK